MNIGMREQTAMVTGASRGIGAATALALAAAGVGRMVLHYNSYKEGAEQVAAGVRTAGCEVELLQADLSKAAEIHALASHAKGAGIDILVNNAGHMVRRAKLLETTDDLYDEVMNLNVKSMWFLSQAVAPGMIEKGSGSIVNVSSIAARNGGGPGAALYAASKATVSCMTKGLAKELAPHGIRVNAVSPGTVDNYFHEKHSTREILNGMLATIPAGKLGTNEEVADTILFLVSDQSRYIFGQTIEINGGMYMI